MSSSDIKVRNAAQAVNEAIAYLNKLNIAGVQVAGAGWQERPIYAPGIQDYAITSRLFTSGDWQIEVYQNVAPLSNTVYQLTAFNGRLNLYWKGSINADGTVTEAVAVKELPEDENRRLAAELARKIAVPAPREAGYGH